MSTPTTEAERTRRTFGMTMPASKGETVCQGHADWCAANGHATWTVDGVDKGVCPRCGEVTEPAKPTSPVGTVFVRSWGYDQTNVDFYELVSVSTTGKTGKARQLRQRTVSGSGGPSEQVVPETGDDRFYTDAGCARCSNRHPGERGWDGHEFTDLYTWQAKTDRLTVTDYGDHAYRWDGRPKYRTGLGWGH